MSDWTLPGSACGDEALGKESHLAARGWGRQCSLPCESPLFSWPIWGQDAKASPVSILWQLLSNCAHPLSPLGPGTAQQLLWVGGVGRRAQAGPEFLRPWLLCSPPCLVGVRGYVSEGQAFKTGPCSAGSGATLLVNPGAGAGGKRPLSVPRPALPGPWPEGRPWNPVVELSPAPKRPFSCPFWAKSPCQERLGGSLPRLFLLQPRPAAPRVG